MLEKYGKQQDNKSIVRRWNISSSLPPTVWGEVWYYLVPGWTFLWTELPNHPPAFAGSPLKEKMRSRETYSLPFLLFFDYFNTKKCREENKKRGSRNQNNTRKKEIQCAAKYDQTKLFSVHMLSRLQMEEQWNMSADKKCINTKRDRKKAHQPTG